MHYARRNSELAIGDIRITGLGRRKLGREFIQRNYFSCGQLTIL